MSIKMRTRRAGYARPRPGLAPRLERFEDRIALSTLTVLNTLDHGSGSLRAAVDAAETGDTIAFAPRLAHGTITLTGGELMLDEGVQIEGPGSGRLTVSGNRGGRVFRVADGADVTIAGLTIAGGLAGRGGGLYAEAGTTVILIGCDVRDNKADIGGGIYNEADARLTLRASTVRDNRAVGATFDDGGGGGVWNGGDLTVVLSTFLGNQCIGEEFGFGGAIENIGGTLTVSRSLFSGNRAVGGMNTSGGAIESLYGNATVTDSVFADNRAVATAPGSEAFGGAVANFDDSPNPGVFNISRCVFTDNWAVGMDGADGVTTYGAGVGGAIFNGYGTLVVSDTLLWGNHSVGGALTSGAPPTYHTGGTGGGILSQWGDLTLANCAFIDNQAVGGGGRNGATGAAGCGGAVDILGGTATISGSLFSGNSAVGGRGGNGARGGLGYGGAVSIGGGAAVTVADSTFTRNLSQAGGGGTGADGGLGVGGAITVGYMGLFGEPDTSSLTLRDSTLDQNSSLGGLGGTRGTGGDGRGGGLAVVSGGATVSRSELHGNSARGGGGPSGGDGLGGGLYVDERAAIAVARSLVTGNSAEGGRAVRGTDGRGVGGGVYGLGAVSLDHHTRIRKNSASTSANDLFVRAPS